jgi:hypothetical protein
VSFWALAPFIVPGIFGLGMIAAYGLGRKDGFERALQIRADLLRDQESLTEAFTLVSPKPRKLKAKQA